MPRPLSPCGTAAAYRRHKRLGEPVDPPCQEAVRVAVEKSRRGKDERAAATVVETIKLEDKIESFDAPADSASELERLRWNLRITEAAMLTGAGNVAALSRQHMDLVGRIARLESADSPRRSALDELAERRAARLAAS